MSVSLIFYSKSDLSVTNPLVSIAFTLANNLSYTAFSTTSLFITLLSLLNLIGTVFNLSISFLPTSAFNVARFNFSTRLDVSVPAAFFKSSFVA